MLDPNIQQIVDELAKNYQPEKVILFGSSVSGRKNEWGDIDLVAIKKTNKGFYDRIQEASSSIPHPIPIDILVYTPEEFEKMAKESYFIKDEIIGKGKVVYEQHS